MPALFVDHCHRSGQVRSLLCSYCNSLLHAVEKHGWEQKAEEYLSRHLDITELRMSSRPLQSTIDDRSYKPSGLIFIPQRQSKETCRVCVPTGDLKTRSRWRNWSLTAPMWDLQKQRQGGTCALCDRQPNDVDHGHETGEIRGLLCRRCNVMLPGLENKNWWGRAKEYLRSHANLEVIEEVA